MLFWQICRSSMLGKVLLAIGLILGGILLAITGAHPPNSSTAVSVAAPLVELKNYKFYEGKIAASIEIQNLINTNISNLFLQLQCKSLSQDNLNFYILLLSKDDPDFIRGAGNYIRAAETHSKISQRHKIERGFTFQEKRNVHLDIDVKTELALLECTKLSVVGYR